MGHKREHRSPERASSSTTQQTSNLRGEGADEVVCHGQHFDVYDNAPQRVVRVSAAHPRRLSNGRVAVEFVIRVSTGSDRGQLPVNAAYIAQARVKR